MGGGHSVVDGELVTFRSMTAFLCADLVLELGLDPALPVSGPPFEASLTRCRLRTRPRSASAPDRPGREMVFLARAAAGQASADADSSRRRLHGQAALGYPGQRSGTGAARWDVRRGATQRQAAFGSHCLDGQRPALGTPWPSPWRSASAGAAAAASSDYCAPSGIVAAIDASESKAAPGLIDGGPGVIVPVRSSDAEDARQILNEGGGPRRARDARGTRPGRCVLRRVL